MIKNITWAFSYVKWYPEFIPDEQSSLYFHSSNRIRKLRRIAFNTQQIYKHLVNECIEHLHSLEIWRPELFWDLEANNYIFFNFLS